MPPPVFNTASELLAHILLQIAPNGNEEITGQRHQDVLVTTVNSLLSIVASLPGQTVNDFPAWSGGTTYPGGVETVVKHGGKLWLFVSSTDSLGTQPGTNGLVWQEINAVQLAHFRNRDQYLDQGGPGEVSAMQLRRLLATRNAWRQAVDAIATEPAGGEPIGYVYAIENGASGDFSGYDGQLAERIATGWSFLQIQDGDTMRFRDVKALLMRITGAWFEFPLELQGLSNVLEAGSLTGFKSITIQYPLCEQWSSVGHNSGGTLTLQLGTQPCLSVNINSAATISFSTSGSAGPSTHWVLLTGAGIPHSLTWPGSTWYKTAGVTLPTTINPGQRYLMHLRRTPSTPPVIMSCDEISFA